MHAADTYIVTGGAGFIGSNLVDHLLAEQPGAKVVVFDALTYAGNPDNLREADATGRMRFVKGDITDRNAVRKAITEYRPSALFHLAAESHVDRSIDGPRVFLETNVMGTFELLAASLDYFAGLDAASKERFRFVHVSTDEVYGSLGAEGYFSETTPYAPNSVYSASKAGSDHMVRAYFETHGLPTVTTNCSNNYGPYQFPEKLVPVVILNALEGKELPVYGDGKNVRDWLHVGDHCSALEVVAAKGRPGQTYNIGGNTERTTIEIVHAICDVLDDLKPSAKSYREQIRFVTDRPGHDRRYAIDASKIANELGWKPATQFADGIRQTVEWYLSHLEWCQHITDGGYRRDRLGLTTGA